MAETLSIPVFAFATGKIRNHWEKASEKDRKEMEAGVREVFPPGVSSVRSALGSENQSSFFISQQFEGFFFFKLWFFQMRGRS